MEPRKLYKAREQILIDGGCAGLAEYLHMSPTAVRAAFVILAFTGFWGVVLYVLSMILIPRSPVSGGSVETGEVRKGPNHLKRAGDATVGDPVRWKTRDVLAGEDDATL